jgi:hypothetical protein
VAPASSATEILIYANIISLVASAALGEAILFLAANSTIRLSGRRVALVRELSRVEVGRVLGLHEGYRVPDYLSERESAAVMNELRHAAEYGTHSAICRLDRGGASGKERLPAA